MKCISFGTRPTSPFAPQGGFLIGEESTDIDCDVLKDFLLSKEEEVLSIMAIGLFLPLKLMSVMALIWNL